MATINVVFGAGGPTGLECVKRLLEVGSHRVRAVVRNPEACVGVFPADQRLEVVRGDVTNPDSCKRVCTGAAGVIFAASGKGYWTPHAVDFKGVENVALAAKEANVKRVVLVSSMLVTPKNWWNPLRLLLNNFRYSLMDYKYKGEEALRKSGVSYTIVRPGGLTRAPGGCSQLLVSQGDSGIQGSRAIARADVAAVCVEALANPKADRVTLELVAAAVGQPGQSVDLGKQVQELWKALKPDV